MTTIAVAPFVLKDVRLTVDADNYESHCSSVTLTPSTDSKTVTWQGLTPAASFTDEANPVTSWSADLEYAQDWETADSLSQYLLDNAGLQKSIKFQPKAGLSGKTFTVTATIVPGPIGGPVGAYATAKVTMKCSGAPAVASDGVA